LGWSCWKLFSSSRNWRVKLLDEECLEEENVSRRPLTSPLFSFDGGVYGLADGFGGTGGIGGVVRLRELCTSFGGMSGIGKCGGVFVRGSPGLCLLREVSERDDDDPEPSVRCESSISSRAMTENLVGVWYIDFCCSPSRVGVHRFVDDQARTKK
jgi:hypothetical protein